MNNFALSSNLCEPCADTNCLSCKSISVCTVCKIGFYVSSATCSACGIGCAKCTDASICTTCLDGFFPRGGVTGGMCDACPTNAFICDNTGNVIQCLPSFAIVEGVCINVSLRYIATDPSSCQTF